MTEEINARCAICGDKSSYDEETVKSCTHNINGVDVVICTNCEEELAMKMGKKQSPEVGRYLSLDIPGTDMFSQAKIGDEGVILDLFKKLEDDDVEVVSSTYMMYDEIGAELVFDEED